MRSRNAGSMDRRRGAPLIHGADVTATGGFKWIKVDDGGEWACRMSSMLLPCVSFWRFPDSFLIPIILSDRRNESIVLVELIFSEEVAREKVSCREIVG